MSMSNLNDFERHLASIRATIEDELKRSTETPCEVLASAISYGMTWDVRIADENGRFIRAFFGSLPISIMKIDTFIFPDGTFESIEITVMREDMLEAAQKIAGVLKLVHDIKRTAIHYKSPNGNYIDCPFGLSLRKT